MEKLKTRTVMEFFENNERVRLKTQVKKGPLK